MTTEIYDRRGKHAPTVASTELRRDIGRFWKLIDRRGSVGICQDGETIAVALSLDQFVSILFGIQPKARRKKSRKSSQSKR